MQTIHDIVTLKNIDGEDFEFMYDKRLYFIPAGQVRRFPRFLADHAVKHLVDKLCNKHELRTSDEAARARFAAQIVVQVETFDEPTARSQADITAERVAELNKPSDLEQILSKRKEVVDQTPHTVVVDAAGHETPFVPPAAPVTPLAPAQAPTTPAAPAVTPPATDEQEDKGFAGLKDKSQPTPPAVTAPEMPSKAQLLAYAKDTLKMNTDEPKTKKALERMTVPQLIKELDYTMPEKTIKEGV